LSAARFPCPAANGRTESAAGLAAANDQGRRCQSG
jgi:hypothetical protein